MSARSQDELWQQLPAGLAGERLSFVPGTDRNTFDSLWRDIGTLDLPQVSRIMREDGAKGNAVRSIQKYASFTGWTGRVVMRNKMSCIAVYLAEHIPLGEGSYNDIKFLWVHPDHHDTIVPLRLTQLARLELPELPSRVSVNAGATKLIANLRDAGWTDLSESSNRATLYAPSVAGREYREALSASRDARSTATGGGRKRR